MVKGLMPVLLVLVAVSSSFGKPEKNGSAKKENKFPQTMSRDPSLTIRADITGRYANRLYTYEPADLTLSMKQTFANNKEIQKMAGEDFILLNLVLRFIADPSLTVRADITGRYGNRLYAYEPADLDLLLSNMKKAKKLLKTEF
ncbi:UNVERIFIED_CONTAM: hypothetical protein FKN15_042903 [Acipenser sinensis]